MYKISSLLFVLSGLLFSVPTLIYKIYISKQKNMMLLSHFVAGMTMFLGLYILLGGLLVFFIPNIINKVLILIFALSPFIIGKFATYKHEKIYSLIQIFCVLISIVFILLV